MFIVTERKDETFEYCTVLDLSAGLGWRWTLWVRAEYPAVSLELSSLHGGRGCSYSGQEAIDVWASLFEKGNLSDREWDRMSSALRRAREVQADRDARQDAGGTEGG